MSTNRGEANQSGFSRAASRQITVLWSVLILTSITWWVKSWLILLSSNTSLMFWWYLTSITEMNI